MERPPVVRMRKGEGTADGVARYCDEHFPLRVLPQLRALEGFLDARVLVRVAGDVHELVVLTTWTSIAAVKAFAGERHERAVVEPEVGRLLERFDREVAHYTVAVAEDGPPPGFR